MKRITHKTLIVLFALLISAACAPQVPASAPDVSSIEDTTAELVQQPLPPTEEPTTVPIADTQVSNVDCVLTTGARADVYLSTNANNKTQLSVILVDAQTCTLFNRELWVKLYVNHVMVYDNYVRRSMDNSLSRLLTEFDTVSISSMELQIIDVCTMVLVTDSSPKYASVDGERFSASCQ